MVLFGIATAAILQVGPGGDPSAVALTADDSSSTTPASEPSSTPDSNGPDGTDAEPFTYRIGVLAAVSTDNFWAFYGEQPSVWNSYMLGPTKAVLYSIDPATGVLQSELATEQVTATFDDDGWRVRVPLRDDLRWSDGSPVTADDVAFTFRTVRNLSLGGSWAESYPEIVESVHADSPTELRIEFSARPTLGIWPHAAGSAPIMSAAYWGDLVSGVSQQDLYGLSGIDDPAGGPLQLESVANSLVLSRRNPGYPLANSPDTVEYRVFETEAQAAEALDQGEIDYLLSPKGLTAELVGQLESNPALEIATNQANGVRYLGFNLARAPMSDLAFRSALALLIDRDALAAEMPNGAPTASSFVSPLNVKWFSPDGARANQDQFAGDLHERFDRALTGLREVGYQWAIEPSVSAEGQVVPGSGLTIQGVQPSPLTILTPGDDYDVSRPAQAAQISETLGLLGFDVRPVETDFDTVVDLAFTPGEDGRLHYDMYLLGWTLGSPAWPGYYRPLFSLAGSMNNTSYSSARFEKALESYESSVDFESAADALWDMESSLASDLPYLLLYPSQINEAYRSDRITFEETNSLGGIQARWGGVLDVSPTG